MGRLSDRDLETMYDDMLDGHYGTVSIGGLEYATSHAMRLVDPTAHRCGFADWLDAELNSGNVYEHTDGNYYDEPEEEQETDHE